MGRRGRDAERCGEVWRGVERCGEVWRGVKRHRDVEWVVPCPCLVDKIPEGHLGSKGP